MLRYDGLVAFDANGIALEAWLEVDGGDLRISVEESCAVYPILVDPVAAGVYLKASNTGEGDQFGLRVAASGGRVVASSWLEDSDGTGDEGDPTSDNALDAGAIYAFDDVAAVGCSYCMPAINSTGAAGRLAGSGSASIAENDLTLVATSLPPTAFGFFITSTTQDFVENPGSSAGNLCLGGLIGRYIGPGQTQQADASGAFSLQLDQSW